MDNGINNPEVPHEKTPLKNTTTTTKNITDKTKPDLTFNTRVTKYFDNVLQLLGSKDRQ